MKSHQIIFLLTGLIAGIICAITGRVWLVMLTYGVGPLFFAAVVTAIAITGARHIQIGFLRYFASLMLCAVTYVVGLVAFFGVAGFSPRWFGVQPSVDILHFRIDIWLGLIAAGVVGASGVTIFTALLTRKGSISLFLRLTLAGFLTTLVTFIANLPFHNYWSFIGVLFPLGSALFCYVVGGEIWQHLRVAASRT